MSEEIDQISFELADDESSNDSFSVSHIYESVHEDQGTSFDADATVDHSVTQRNQDTVKAEEYAVYNNDHHKQTFIEWSKMHRKKIIVGFILIAGAISIAVSLEFIIDADTQLDPTNEPELNDNTTTTTTVTTTHTTAETTLSPDQNDILTGWSNWSKCSKSCGRGIQERNRKCLQDFCNSSTRETVTCSNMIGCE